MDQIKVANGVGDHQRRPRTIRSEQAFFHGPIARLCGRYIKLSQGGREARVFSKRVKEGVKPQ